ncbi:hypothetical protein BJ165DRAFT_1596203 [Panaeolus papilionaceus]|nr:hypothetical protein BJ165DRAFT_1596203 [Panaeolus papilionaceus]
MSLPTNGVPAAATMPSSPPVSSIVLHLHAGKYFQTASFVMLVYDHMLTFSDEVDRIWKQKISGASILFLINRYITPLQVIVIMDAFDDPSWTRAVCDRFVVFEGASTAGLVAVCELIMILRVYALYERSNVLLALLLVLWTLQLVFSMVGVFTGQPVPLPPSVTGCILTSRSLWFSFLWSTPLVTDFIIFFLTIWRTRRYIRGTNLKSLPTIHVLVRDGALYFFAIFSANLMNTLIYFAVPQEDLKAIGATFSKLITSVMISRLVLNLRSLSSEAQDQDTIVTALGTFHVRGATTGRSAFMTRTIGNLLQDFLASDEEEEHYEFAEARPGVISVHRTICQEA